MRLLLLPLTRSTPLICWQSLGAPAVRTNPRLDDRLVDKAAALWSKFGRSEKTWQRTIVQWGDRLLERIQIEEWGLKTIPPINTYKRFVHTCNDENAVATASSGASAAAGGQWSEPRLILQKGLPASKVEPIKLVYPHSLYTEEQALAQLQSIARGGLKIHRRKMIWCAIVLPLTLPVALIPIIPNLPGFYVLYRLWSHWTAYTGAKHLDLLLRRKEFQPQRLGAVEYTYSNKDFEQVDATQVERLERIFESPHLCNELERALRHLTTKGIKIHKAE